MLLAGLLTACFTAPPQIISLEPNRGSTSVPADAPVEVVFDRPVTHASVASRFSVRPTIAGCDLRRAFTAPSSAACSVRWLTTASGFELVHEGAVFAPSTRYTFTLAGGFADASGDSNGLDHHWDLTSAPAPVLASSSPADRATGVAVDAQLAVSFTAPMDPTATAAAITLEPPVPGTRVVRNTTDHSRFVILPGHFLAPGTAYQVTVAATARGEDQQTVAAPLAVRFTTGLRMGSAHAAVLAGLPTEAATEVLLPALSSAETGEPIAAPLVLDAARCEVAGGCNGVVDGAALETYTDAAVSADATHLAVVAAGAGPSGGSRLIVLDTVGGRVVADIPGGDRPSWSPDGTAVALVTSQAVEVLDVATGAISVVAGGGAVTASPLWASNTTLVLSLAGDAAGSGSVELVNRDLGAAYQLPGAPTGSLATAVSPAGGRVALATPDGGGVVLPVEGAAVAQPLDGPLRVVGFAGEGTLVVVDQASGGEAQLARVSVGGGDTTVVALGSGSLDLATLELAPNGRTLAGLAVDAAGMRQAYVAAADGTGVQPMTQFAPGGVEAQQVAFSS